MEDHEYMGILRQHDQSQDPEFPDGFVKQGVYQECVCKFNCFKRSLGNVMQRELYATPQEHMQDCSFHAELHLPAEVLIDPKENWLYCLRFSNFGQMVELSDEESVKEGTRKLIATCLDEHGYILIPTGLLRQPYDGKFRFIKTWHVRYFDYQ